MLARLAIVRAIYWLKSLGEDPVEIFERLGVKSDDQILEIGCAIGYHTFALARLAPEGKVYAVDIWAEGLQFLQSRIKPGQNIEIIHDNAEDIEFPPASLDKIFCFNTLHELSYPKKALQRWAKFLKGDGKLYFKDPEISPEQVEKLSEGKLQKVGTVHKISIFAPKPEKVR
jgi:ubiquinone/menaquinone biosynthesis C-methylase UbiE